jgi:hypothetical protein
MGAFVRVANDVAGFACSTVEQPHGLMLRMPKSLHTALRHVSIDRGQSLNTLITEVLEQWWSTQPEHPTYSKGKKR